MKSTSLFRQPFTKKFSPHTFDKANHFSAFPAYNLTFYFQCCQSREEDPSLTDDASVAERSGHVISLFEGSYENIKITTPEDLIIAEALLKAKTKAG
jgi:2-C-methyl-D-erythritol 4-phosphate cytidylyltransferase